MERGGGGQVLADVRAQLHAGRREGEHGGASSGASARAGDGTRRESNQEHDVHRQEGGGHGEGGKGVLQSGWRLLEEMEGRRSEG